MNPAFARMRSAFFASLSIGIVGALGSGCSSEDPPAVVVGPAVRFVLSEERTLFLDVPFPSDLYLVPPSVPGGRPRVKKILGFDRVIGSNVEFLTHELAKLDGFSPVALSLFLVEDSKETPNEFGLRLAKLDAASLPQTEDACALDQSSVFLLKVVGDPASPTSLERLPCRAVAHIDEVATTSAAGLAVGPSRGIVLEEGTRYITVVTDRVRDRAGLSVQRSPGFETAIASHPLYSKAYTQAMGAVGRALEATGSKIVALTPYTTSRSTDDLFRLRKKIEGTKPELKWDAASMAPMGAVRFGVTAGGTLPNGFTATLDAYLGKVSAPKLPSNIDDPDVTLPVRAHDQIASYGTAVFRTRRFLRDKGGYQNLDHATIDENANYTETTEPVWVSVVVPKKPAPPAGYPAVIVQHGMGGSRDNMWGLANTLAAAGWIAVGIDSVTFGARAPTPRFQKDVVSEFAGAPGGSYTGPDGLADRVDGKFNDPTDRFGIMKNLGALRDQLKQAALDISQLVMLLRDNPDLSSLSVDGAPIKIDPNNIGYYGVSLGGIEGALIAAIEPNIRRFVLDNAGGGLLLELASHGPSVYRLLQAAGGINFRLYQNYFGESNVLNTVGQNIIDAGDPLLFAPYVFRKPKVVDGETIKLPARSVLQTEVIYDELVSNESGEALARALGLSLSPKNVGSNAGVTDPKNLGLSRYPVPLTIAKGDESSMLVQVSSGQHGTCAFQSSAKRSYRVPYSQFDKNLPYDLLPEEKTFRVRCPYREVQNMVVSYFQDAWAGKEPKIVLPPAPVRDTDDDGTPDATDPEPSNPLVK